MAVVRRRDEKQKRTDNEERLPLTLSNVMSMDSDKTRTVR